MKFKQTNKKKKYSFINFLFLYREYNSILLESLPENFSNLKNLEEL